VRQTADCIIVGYTKGKGNRDQRFGALHIAEKTDSGLQYRGKVGTGFSDKTMTAMLKVLHSVKEVKKPALVGKLLDEKVSTWLEPKIAVEVSYAMITSEEMFREPVFIRLRPDLE
jgi:ATP-dependent DNA ligase